MTDETPLAVTLSVAEWNLVLAQLSEGQFRLVAPLIGKIRDQAMKALAPAAPPAAAPPPPNGPLAEPEADHGLAN